MAEAKSIWSAGNSRLQRAWDATSLRALMFCPRYYQLSIIEGWRGSSVDLEFGILYHGALDVFDKARLAGKSKAEATLLAVRWALENSGHYVEVNPELPCGDPEELKQWVPWGGRYARMWRCTGLRDGEKVPYKNAKGNAAKCPYSHKGRWEQTEPPSICGECGAEIEVQDVWWTERPDKDRPALIRMVCWYCEEQPEELGSSGVAPYAFPDGTPAVELNFVVPLPWQTPQPLPLNGTVREGEDYLLCGYLDGLRTFGDEMFVGERKTTKKGLNKGFWAGFSPHIQVDTYDVAGAAMFPNLPISGVLVEGAQALASGARFGYHLAYRNEAQREEYMRDLRYWLDSAERYAEDGYWPMNRANCWLCGFKGVCGKNPASREEILKAEFEKSHWNPLEER